MLLLLQFSSVFISSFHAGRENIKRRRDVDQEKTISDLITIKERLRCWCLLNLTFSELAPSAVCVDLKKAFLSFLTSGYFLTVRGIK